MKFFHIADLHIGKTVSGFSMLEDQAFVFDQIIAAVNERRPDAVLIAGDVYDKPAPGADAVALFDGFLTSLVRAGTAVMIISGNHDSPERLNYAGGIMDASGVYVCGAFTGAPRVVTLSDEFGKMDFYLLPFVRPASVRRFFSTSKIESYYDAICAALGEDIGAQRRSVVLAHQFFAPPGGKLERSESEFDPIGGLDAVDSRLLERFDYAALGHLHSPQSMAAGRVRYAGSPLKYSFSERFHNKSITQVKLRKKGDIEVSTIPLMPRRDLRGLKGRLDELLAPDAVKLGDTSDYVYVTLTDDGELRDALERVRSVYPNCMALTFDNARTRAQSRAVPEATLSPKELFEAFYLEQNGQKLGSDQAALFLKALEEADDEAD